MATILGSRNADRLSARANGDAVEGLGGNDTLSSGTTYTGISLFGGDGSDTLIAKASDTLIDGGAGVDTVQFAAAVASLANTALEGVEKVVITNTSAAVYNFGSQTEALNITGGRAADSITGGAGNDTITGGLGADSLMGDEGDDVLVAEATDALISGGNGNDTVQFAAAVTTGLTDLELDGVENVVITNTGNAAYDFSLQAEVLNITGGRGKDTITGGTAADTLRGGNGNDTLIAVGTAGANQDALVDGGAGNDTVKYAADVTSLVDAKLTNVEYVVITDATGGTYDFSSQTEGLDITGNAGADIIKGGSGADALRGGLDGDTLHAGDNDKLIDGGNGTDTAVFAASVSAKNLLDADLINVERIVITDTGSYDFSAQREKLVITGSAGADTITGGKGVDTIRGGEGDDVIVASDLDVIDGGNSTDTAIGAAGTDTVRFAAAVSATNLTNDDLKNIDNIVITNSKAATYDFSAQVGEAFNITGGSGNDTIKTATGTVDTINAGAGNDVIVAEDTDALIDGGTGIDTVQFAAAVSATNLLDEEFANVEYVVITNTTDTDGIDGTYDFTVQTESLQITGTKYDDAIDGGYRADTITGGAGADELSGNEGADLLIADTSDTLIDGGVGDDTVRFAAAVTGLLDAELVNVENVVITNTGNAAYDFSDQGTTVDVTENLNITGGSGSDTITGGADADTLSGGAGNDLLVAQATDALIDGGAGTDTVRFAAAVSAADLVNADLVNVERIEITGAGIYDFSAQTEVLTIAGGSSAVTIEGGSGADSITGGSSGDNLDGNAGADTLVGGAGADTLTGGTGVDYLYGGDDEDILIAEDTDGKIDGGANNLPGGFDVARFGSSVSAVNLTNAKLVEIERVEITNTSAASYDFSAQTEALIIVGGTAADTITGTQDWDTFVVSLTSDVDVGESYNGAAGTDTLQVTAVEAQDLSGLTGLTSVEVIELASGVGAIFAASALTGDSIAVKGTSTGAGTETLTVNGTVAVAAIDDTIDLSGLTLIDITGNVTINGFAGNDTITGTSGGDTFIVDAGTDTITNISGSDVLQVSSGATAIVTVSAPGSWAASASTINNGAVTINFELLASGANLSSATGSNGFTVNLGSDSDNVTGSAQNDTITGGNGNDVISGGNGNDVISGGNGNDAIAGGVGADVIIFAASGDSAVAAVVVTGGNAVITEAVGDVVTGDVSDTFDIVAGAGVYTALTTTTVLADGSINAATYATAGLDVFVYKDGTDFYLAYETAAGTAGTFGAVETVKLVGIVDANDTFAVSSAGVVSFAAAVA